MEKAGVSTRGGWGEESLHYSNPEERAPEFSHWLLVPQNSLAEAETTQAKVTSLNETHVLEELFKREAPRITLIFS